MKPSINRLLYVAICAAIVGLLSVSPAISQQAIRIYGTVTGGASKPIAVDSSGSMSISLSGGGASTSDLTITKTAPTVILNSTGAVGGLNGTIRFQEAGVTRWELTENGTSDIKLNRYNSSGVFQDQPFTATATGLTTINNQLSRSGGTTYLLGTGTGAVGLGVNTNGDVAQMSRAPNVNTTNLTTTAAQSGQVISNRGASGAITITLLNDPTEGIFYTIVVHAVQQITIVTSAGEAMKFGASTCATSLVSNTSGSAVTLNVSGTGNGATWMTTAFTGTWTCT